MRGLVFGDNIMHERERQRDRLEAAAAAADRSVEIAQSYVVPAFVRSERGASTGAQAGACEGGGGCGLCIVAVVVLGSG